MIKGGEFLIKDQEAKDIFIPEDFGEEQLMMASATKEFVEKELDPHREQFEKKRLQTNGGLHEKSRKTGAFRNWSSYKIWWNGNAIQHFRFNL